MILIISLIFVNISALPRGFIESGKPIACERGQPVKLTDFFPDLINPRSNGCKIYCFCPESSTIECEPEPECKSISKTSKKTPTSMTLNDTNINLITGYLEPEDTDAEQYSGDNLTNFITGYIENYVAENEIRTRTN